MTTPHNQHAQPLSDIDIAQAAKMKPIMAIAEQRLGIAAEHLSPYGHTKAKLGLDYVAGCKPDRMANWCW